MKIGSQLQFEIPDTCPENCPHQGSLKDYSYKDECQECPIWLCEYWTDVIGDRVCLVEPKDFKDELIPTWQQFFKGLVNGKK